MKIQTTNRQNFGRIITPEGYVNKQIAKVKNPKGKKIIRDLLKIVDKSDVVDISVDKSGKCTLSTKIKKLSDFVRIITRAKRKEQIKTTQNGNNFIAALIRGAHIDSKNSRYMGIHTASEDNLHTFIKKWNNKYKSLIQARIYGVYRLIRLEEPIEMGIRTINTSKFY